MTAPALRGEPLAIAIPLTHDRFAAVDFDDFHLVAGYTWRFHEEGYARAEVDGVDVYMHRLILGAVSGADVDHRNGNGLDNRRLNLRLASRAQNNGNMRAGRAASGFKGVHFDARNGGRYRAYITHNQQKRHLGGFDTAEEAARAYDVAAATQFGEFARLNFPEVEVS